MTNRVKRLSPKESDLKVIEEVFDALDPDDQSLIRISEQQVIAKKQFNTLTNAVCRELTVTGIQLRWDGSNEALDAISITRDISKLTIIADEIYIEKPLQWKGAEVEIYARKLIFRKSGSIETTPERYPSPAFSDKKDDNGRPLDKNNKIKAKDGLAGENGGAISLYVNQVDNGKRTTIRLITDGSAGQIGEQGGLYAFEPIGRSKKKNVDTVLRQDIKDFILDSNNSTGDLNKLSVWRFRGNKSLVSGDSGLNEFWKVSKEQRDKGYKITDVRIGLLYAKPFSTHATIASLPNGELKYEDVTANPAKGKKLWETMKEFKNPNVPSDGEDAYASGTTGRGGDAGIIRACPQIVSQILFRAEGGASEKSPLIKGGKAGKPKKHIQLAFTVIQDYKTGISGSKPQWHLTEGGTTKDGKAQPGTAAGAGKTQKTVSKLSADAWLEPRLLRAISNYARRLFAAGHRESTWNLIQPYWQKIVKLPAAKIPNAESRAGMREILNLAQNHQQNLDLYGNPPGWTPRFSVDSYLRTYLADRSFSYRFVGIMKQASELVDSMLLAERMLSSLAKQTETTIVQIREELYAAFERYHNAKNELDVARDEFNQAQEQLDVLQENAKRLALLRENDKAILNAVFDVSAAILEAIPVYQPALSGVAQVVKGVGEFTSESIYGKDPTDAWKALETIGSSVGDFLKNNAGQLKSQFSTKLKKKYENQLNTDEADLKNQVTKLQTQISAGQTLHDDLINKTYDKISGNELLKDLISTDADLLAQQTENSANRDALRRKLKEYNAMLDELDETAKNSSGLGQELALQRKQQLVVAKRKLFTLLADAQNEARDLEQKRAGKKEDKTKIDKQLDAIESRRSDLEDKTTKLDKLLPDLTKLETEKKIEEKEKLHGKVLDGVERFAKSAAKVGGTISGVIKGPDPDSDAVIELQQRILNSELKEDYEAALELVERAGARMSKAIADLAQCNQGITTLTTDFTSALHSTIDIGRSRQAFAMEINAGTKATVAAMQQQAQERMSHYLYLFRRAYLYEFCRSAGKSVANMNTLTTQMDQLVQSSLEAKKLITNKTTKEQSALRSIAYLADMKTDQLKDLGDQVLKNTLSNLASDIMSHRQAVGNSAWQPTYIVSGNRTL